MTETSCGGRKCYPLELARWAGLGGMTSLSAMCLLGFYVGASHSPAFWEPRLVAELREACLALLGLEESSAPPARYWWLVLIGTLVGGLGGAKLGRLATSLTGDPVRRVLRLLQGTLPWYLSLVLLGVLFASFPAWTDSSERDVIGLAFSLGLGTLAASIAVLPFASIPVVAVMLVIEGGTRAEGMGRGGMGQRRNRIAMISAVTLISVASGGLALKWLGVLGSAKVHVPDREKSDTAGTRDAAGSE